MTTCQHSNSMKEGIYRLKILTIIKISTLHKIENGENSGISSYISKCFLLGRSCEFPRNSQTTIVHVVEFKQNNILP